MSDDRNNLQVVWERSPWSNRHHTQNQIESNLGFESGHLLPYKKKDIREMTHHEMSTRNIHKEEMMSRMLSDANDSGKPRNKLEESINPVDSA